MRLEYLNRIPTGLIWNYINFESDRQKLFNYDSRCKEFLLFFYKMYIGFFRKKKITRDKSVLPQYK